MRICHDGALAREAGIRSLAVRGVVGRDGHKSASCGKAQTFSEAPVRLEEGQTRYRCKNGCGDIAAIAEAAPDTVDWGYRLGDYVLNNAADVFVPVRGHLLIVPAAHKVTRGDGGRQPSASE